MLKPKRADRLIHCLVCWTCHGRIGPNHIKMEGGGVICGLCQSKNPLGNLRKMSLREVTEPSEIIVCFTQGGTSAHALHIDAKTPLGPWIKFSSGETLERCLKYLGGSDEQLAAYRKTMQQTGQGSSHIRLLPNRKNLLRIDYSKL
jgi:hypothetical protein